MLWKMRTRAQMLSTFYEGSRDCFILGIIQQPIRDQYLDHVNNVQPIRDRYLGYMVIT